MHSFITYCTCSQAPPSLHAVFMRESHIQEIKRQLINATEPLLNVLISNYKFIEEVTNKQFGTSLCVTHLPEHCLSLHNVPHVK